MAHSDSIILLTTFFLSANRVISIPYSIIQLSIKRDAIGDAVVFGNGPKIFIVTNSNVPLALNSVGGVCDHRSTFFGSIPSILSASSTVFATSSQ